MKSNELRVGNLIQFGEMIHECKPCDILNIYQAEIAQSGGGEYKPIKLTSEWIKKIGGKDFSRGFWFSIPNLKAELHLEQFPKNQFVAILKSDFSNLILDPIKSVHELQNIVYSLSAGCVSLNAR